MDLTENQGPLKDILAATLTKAWEDETFKQQLLASPIDAMENLTGVRLNSAEVVKMMTKDQPILNSSYSNDPSNSYTEDIELTENELELVAGGDGDKKSLEDLITYVESWFE